MRCGFGFAGRKGRTLSKEARSDKRIYLSPPHVGAEERALLLDAFDSNWIAPLGPHVDAFEREMAEQVGVADAAALSSGTAGLHLALELLGVGSGDWVVVPTLTFAATANAVRYVGAEPVFMDCDRGTWQLDPNLLEEELRAASKRSNKPAAVIAVDLYGQCADYDRICRICEEHDVPLIEDAAEALGAKYRDRNAGSFGVMSILSFNGNKIITTSGGGMLLSNQHSLVERARYLASQAREPARHYEHNTVGYNYRLSNLLAAVGRAQLRSLPARVERRREINRRYRAILGELPGIELMEEAAYGASTFWLTCGLIDAPKLGASRDAILNHLASRNIEARPVWKPMHLQPVYRDCRAIGGDIATDLFDRGICLPSGSSLSNADQERVLEAILSIPELKKVAL